MKPEVTIERLTGRALIPHVADVARLRIAVFQEYPYLYDGKIDYEEKYLRRYLENPASVFVLARADRCVVGVSTGCPLVAESKETREVFTRNGFNVEEIFYFGESVLLPEFRGRGLGHSFFDEREAHARAQTGFRWTSFCAVERAPDDPRQPPGYRPHDVFWYKRGYAKHPELRTTFSWQEIGEAAETPKPMVFWIRRLETKT
jgi:hypothetical protein